MDRLEYINKTIDYWSTPNNYCLYEASVLWVEAIPYSSDDNHEDEHGIAPIQRALVEAIDSGELPAKIRRHENGTLDWNESSATKADLARWAIKLGQTPGFLRREIEKQLLEIESTKSDSLSSRRTYMNSRLALLDQAIERFWTDYDKSNPPDKETVISWLKSKGCSTSMATHIDAIIRPDEKAKGGRPKKKF